MERGDKEKGGQGEGGQGEGRNGEGKIVLNKAYFDQFPYKDIHE
jgi:hypothetical protein